MRLVVRADASVRMGTGHLMRCLALAQAWQDAGGSVDFLTRCESDALAGRLCQEGFLVQRLGSKSDAEALQSARADGVAALVLDGYHFDAAYQERAREFFRPLIAIDDLAELPMYSADVVLNQNIFAPRLQYPHRGYTRLLLGTQWALLRREFLRWANWQRVFPTVARRVLVTLGGSDPDNVVCRVIEALDLSELREELETMVVVGAGNPHLPQLQTVARMHPNLELRANVTDMPAVMAWADTAITAGGSTCWEAAFMSLPSLILVLAANQTGNASGLDSATGAINLGWHEDVKAVEIAQALDAMLRSQERRRAIGETGRRLVNGDGAHAAVAAIRELL
ncbi:MAG: UDP-2,4-diacetamido-2,4,6-trideoxy-beta-L-altropyranose hydrolase [Bryobacteraceae bacterium]